ncbi:MAG: hypothetical protein ABIP02_07685, partial [Arenimonas sp.]
MSINPLNRILLVAVISTSLIGLSTIAHAQGHDKGQDSQAEKAKKQDKNRLDQNKQDKANGADRKVQAEQAQGQQRMKQTPQAAKAVREQRSPTRVLTPRQDAAKQTQAAQQRLRLQTEISAAERQQAAHATQTAQQALRESDQHKHKKNYKNQAQESKFQRRLSEQQRLVLIKQQQQRVVLYRQNVAKRQTISARQILQLQQQKRLSQYSYQQQYYDRLRTQQLGYQNNNFNYNNDPYFYTASNYRYDRDGRNYETNQYGADILRQAMNYGYQEGMRAGRADQQDNWRYSYRDSTIYEDANYGYN